MADKLQKMYYGTLSKYKALGTKENSALYFVQDETTKVKSIYRGETKVSGDFIIVDGITPKNIEQGVIYYISEHGGTTNGDGTGKAFVGFYDGGKWVALSSEATIETIDAQIKAIEAKIGKKKDGDAESTGLYKEIEDAVKAEETRAKAAEEVLDGKITAAQESGKVNLVKIDTPSATNIAEYKLQQGGVDIADSVTIAIPKDKNLVEVKLTNEAKTTQGLTDKPIINDLAGDEKGNFMTFVYQNAEGKYDVVSIDVTAFLKEAVFGNGLATDARGVTSVNPTDGSFIVFEGEEDNKKTLGLKIADVSQVKDVKLVDGNLVAYDAQNVEVADGLVSQNAIMKVIIDNEKVTASAFNDLNTRLGKNDSLTTTTKDDIVGAINEIDAKVKAIKPTEVAQKETVQDVTVETDNDTKKVTIGVNKAAYTQATNGVAGSFITNGLVDNDVMANYVNDQVEAGKIVWQEL